MFNGTTVLVNRMYEFEPRVLSLAITKGPPAKTSGRCGENKCD